MAKCKTMTTTLNVGCYGDGTHGHDYTRVKCAMTLEAYAWDQEQIGNTERARYMRETARALRGPMSDAACEESEACLFLDDVAAHPSAYWGWNEGDFGLWPIDDTDYGYGHDDSEGE
jgi:hypothetical protein